ncbi:MAG: dUTP diphosphatase [Treponema sp.]|nr:dUTP diphosphatase [Treponema sp.]
MTAVKVYRKKSGAALPFYATSGAAGADLAACIDADIVLYPAKRVKVPTGLVLEIPEGFEAQVRPRSGFAWKTGVTVLNAPGTIDSDYRGELEILLVNLGSEPRTIKNGDRIAQLVVAPVVKANFKDGEPAPTGRGQGGFGSTGT